MVRQLLAGTVPTQGVVVERVKGGKYAPMPAGIHKNGTENGWFPKLIDLKILKMLFFAQKYLIKYTPKMFFLRNTLI